MDKTKIEWTDATWNPVRGCSRVSEGCRFCYAERMAVRFSAPGAVYHGFAATKPWGWTGKVELVPHKLKQPLAWKRPRRIFVNSMSDLFHESLSLGDISRVFETMVQAHQHTYQILTKRPQRMLEVTQWLNGNGLIGPESHVWLGVSVEDQATADERIPILLRTPAAVRFVSFEPALGLVDFAPWLRASCSVHAKQDGYHCCAGNAPRLPPISWLIVGGESGPAARRCNLNWIRTAVLQCEDAGIPCFVKQLGMITECEQVEPGWEDDCWPYVRESDNKTVLLRANRGGKGEDMLEWPKDLRVREFPVGATRL